MAGSLNGSSNGGAGHEESEGGEDGGLELHFEGWKGLRKLVVCGVGGLVER